MMSAFKEVVARFQLAPMIVEAKSSFYLVAFQ